MGRQLTLMDAVSQAGGITQNAKTDHVLVISGGIADPSLKLVDIGGFLYRGELQDNFPLERGDIVYVPKNELGTAERYFDFAVKAMGRSYPRRARLCSEARQSPPFRVRAQPWAQAST